MNKKELKKFLIENETYHIHNSEQNLIDFVKGTMLNRYDVIDQDDQSHHRQEEQLRKKLDFQVNEHEHHLEEIKALSFEKSTKVEPGAVIKVNDNYMVIATADGKFNFNGKEFLSISSKAPIYQCIMEKKKGDTCNFNGNNFIINEIY
ncbi:hypothetical protein [Flavobacterium oreochromis]|uniref:3-oxoacyl-ACP synthase n=1 Tax=Flavobacterium columnare TaxID=996 RepID=A0A246G854_9FLAO|nr:hypothetical protein [Flavobacterium oreochromis]OWP74938.1 hypothetical protein BWK62_13090 [Flavobacterium oreochromis]